MTGGKKDEEWGQSSDQDVDVKKKESYVACREDMKQTLGDHKIFPDEWADTVKVIMETEWKEL